MERLVPLLMVLHPMDESSKQSFLIHCQPSENLSSKYRKLVKEVTSLGLMAERFTLEVHTVH